MIRKWKEERKNLLIIDAGDLLYPRASKPPSQDGKAVMNVKAMAIVEAFNHMGCDAITIGEDDLLWGKENLLEIIKGREFSVVSANLIDSESGKPLFRPYVIKQMGGFKVGIFGLFPKSPHHKEGQFRGLTVLEPFGIAQKVVSKVRKKADFVILLSHLGYAKDLELARKVEGINVIAGGHNGINLSHPRIIQNTVVLQVGNRGRYLGRIDITINDPSLPPVNVATREMLRKRLERIETQLKALGSETPQDSAKNERTRDVLKRRKAEVERALGLYKGNNQVANQVVPLTDKIPEDAECMRVLRPYLLRISEVEKTSRPEGGSSPDSPREKPE